MYRLCGCCPAAPLGYCAWHHWIILIICYAHTSCTAIFAAARPLLRPLLLPPSAPWDGGIPAASCDLVMTLLCVAVEVDLSFCQSVSPLLRLFPRMPPRARLLCCRGAYKGGRTQPSTPMDHEMSYDTVTRASM